MRKAATLFLGLGLCAALAGCGAAAASAPPAAPTPTTAGCRLDEQAGTAGNLDTGQTAPVYADQCGDEPAGASK